MEMKDKFRAPMNYPNITIPREAKLYMHKRTGYLVMHAPALFHEMHPYNFIIENEWTTWLTLEDFGKSKDFELIGDV